MVGTLTSSLANAMIIILAPLCILAYVNLSTPMRYLAHVLMAANGTFHAEGGKIFKAVARMKNMEGLNASVLMKVSGLHMALQRWCPDGQPLEHEDNLCMLSGAE